jgi:hypothetical protein
MKLTDEKLIEFLWKSPVKSFAAMLDSLRYLDGNWMWEDLEYELFDDALGDNATQTVKIRVPQIRGIAANALLAFAHHAQVFNLIRRRPKAMQAKPEAPEEIIVFYEMTPSGSYVVKVLELLTDITERNSAAN